MLFCDHAVLNATRRKLQKKPPFLFVRYFIILLISYLGSAFILKTPRFSTTRLLRYRWQNERYKKAVFLATSTSKQFLISAFINNTLGKFIVLNKMNTKLSWILLAFILCSLVSWGSTFAPGSWKPKTGKRQMALKPGSNQVCRERSSSCKTWCDILDRLICNLVLKFFAP